MLEAKLENAILLKRLLDSIKELVTDANFECNEDGLKLQAMDNSHVALVAVDLNTKGFVNYRCDRPMPLGVNVASLTKVLKCAKDDDIVTLKASDDADILNLTYEGTRSDRIAEYDMKLMDIDADNLGIPDTEYDAHVTMSSSEFSRIVRDLAQLGESVRIEVSKDGVRFAAEGEAANGSVLMKQTDAAKRKFSEYEKEMKRKVKKEPGTKDEDDDNEEEDDQEEGSSKKANGTQVKKESSGDVEMEENPDVDEDGEEEKPQADSEDEEREIKKRKRDNKEKSAGKSKRSKKSSDEDSGPADGVAIDMSQHVALTFSLKYLVNFSKSASLSEVVKLNMSNDVPLLVSYDFGPGKIQYYLAPKIGDE